MLGGTPLCPGPVVAQGLRGGLEGAALREERARLGIEGDGKEERDGT